MISRTEKRFELQRLDRKKIKFLNRKELLYCEYIRIIGVFPNYRFNFSPSSSEKVKNIEFKTETSLTQISSNNWWFDFINSKFFLIKNLWNSYLRISDVFVTKKFDLSMRLKPVKKLSIYRGFQKRPAFYFESRSFFHHFLIWT